MITLLLLTSLFACAKNTNKDADPTEGTATKTKETEEIVGGWTINSNFNEIEMPESVTNAFNKAMETHLGTKLTFSRHLLT